MIVQSKKYIKLEASKRPIKDIYLSEWQDGYSVSPVEHKGVMTSSTTMVGGTDRL